VALAYDGNGNMTEKLELKGETAYEYDAAGNRLTETTTVDNSDTITEYAYNERGWFINSVEASGGEEKTTLFN